MAPETFAQLRGWVEGAEAATGGTARGLCGDRERCRGDGVGANTHPITRSIACGAPQGRGACPVVAHRETVTSATR